MEQKIKAVQDGDRIKVHAEFSVGKKKVHEINTAFPLDTDPETIEAEVKKAGELFVLEQKQGKKQKEVDAIHKKAQDTINKLNEEPTEEVQK